MLVTKPEGWIYAAIIELCTLINGKAFKPSDWTERGLPIIRIQNLNNPNAIFNHFSGEVEAKFLVKKGELLFAWSGTPGTSFGAHIWDGEKAVLNQHIFRVLFDDKLINKKFFQLAINHKLQYLIAKAQGGVGLAHITKGKFEQTEILLPPLNEQRRIVEKIEALKARSQRVKEALEDIPQLLDQFRQSVLAAAFRGDLTADWREQNPDVEPASVLLERTAKQLNKNFDEYTKKNDIQGRPFIPDSWVWTPLDLVIKNIQSGKNFTCPETPVNENTVGLVKISAVTWGKFDHRETKTVIEKSKIDPKLFIQKGDFLISRANTLELVGASVIVDEINYNIMISDKIWRVSFLEVNSNYINSYLKSKAGRKEIESRATGNQLSMRNISQGAFKDIIIALPPLDEQKEIVRQIQYFFKVADTIQQQYQETKANLALLDQSILAKAFRGELVPQDPNDEPASVLLERIRAERDKLQTKGAKKSTPQTGGRRSKKASQQEAEPVQLELGLE
ncbi:restriction endonuclease subunit S [Nostoc sp. DedQUE09]|uniref:restriction endonuclease subunit S n=1 Tax=Nostoc sp. DedQUE09 TaxID=3075394 RepID=UPI002AD56C00|nr:restriction endonuclease subunit S [Nostoc sp. DedQUE09]MDZ7955880.1 restriction endonuclease subunit S [Nostoc sp. DedQUE09]